KPQKKQSRRKQRKNTEDPQLSGPTEPVPDDTKDMASVPTHSNDPLLSDEGLGDQEDASKQGRKIADIDADAEDMVEKEVSIAEVTTDSATITTVDELTLAHTLIEIKATKPKARGVIVQEPSEFTTTPSPSQPSQLPQAKDKGKAKMVEPKKPLKKKDRIMFNQEVAQKLQAQLDAELEKEEKLARQREEDANIAEWDNILFDKEMKRVNTFVDMDTELVKEEAEMKKHMKIVPDDEVAIDAIPLATKPPIIVEWKIIKEGKMGYFQIIRDDGSSKRYSSMIKMLQSIDREDLETLWKLVKAKHGLTRPEEAYERVL
ncbi:hypothetical protein Tco_1519296, partial [Tanacetum coccineum]